MSALVQNIGLSNDNPSVTKISAYARIDYILRFSKQAILVIDESHQQNAALSGQFLASLSEQHNAAYISLSAKFNNIQIRCRIIEQLCTGELFDPELSLAVSVINLAKKSQQAISIVLDNAQYLSLQILHEVSQLAAIAKKANLTVNIVMFGSVQAGRNVADHKSLFDNKLALLSAQSGQLLSSTSSLFKNTQPSWHFIVKNKWLISLLIILLALGGMVIGLLKQDSFNFAKSIVPTNQEKISLAKVLAKPQTMVLTNDAEVNTQALAAEQPLVAHQVVNDGAISQDVYESLMNPSAIVEIKAPMIPASPADIISAIAIADDDVLSIERATRTDEKIQKKQGVKAENNALSKQLPINNNYYIGKTGYVVQIAALSDFQLPEIFLETLADIDYNVYQRILNDQPLLVFTSTIYADKSAAQLALSQFPPSLLKRQPWIKSVEVINSEINAFLYSQ